MARRSLNWWGIASTVLLIGDYGVWMYNFHLEDAHRRLLFSRSAGYELCFVAQLAAAICGIIAIRRGSWAWMWTVLPSLLLAFQCFLGDL